METTDNIKSQMKKGVMDLCVLSILQGEEAYPSDMLQILNDAKIAMPEGTLYPILTRLKNAGYLNYRWVESTEGPPRKYFCLTSEGEHQLSQLLQGYAEITKAIETVLNRKIK
jgi:PadR family transcriptional regulator, regulatory protein PadR